MDTPNKTRLIDLLREREDAFVRVWDCEQQINRIFGASYPFPPPPKLPSQARRKRRRGAPAGKSRSARGALRTLHEGRENAYHVCYTLDGVDGETFQTDTELLERLLADAIEGFRITRIEAVLCRSLRDWTPVEVLFPNR